jgi:CheY-like chemotaxis protein
MDSADDALWFMGDLSDPWVVMIAGELARCTRIVQVHCPGELSERPFDGDCPPRMIVIHRHRFTAVDAERLKNYRDAPADAAGPAIFLCISPFVRYEELERWSGLADLVISEATAAEILPRHVARLVQGQEGRTTRADTAGYRVEVAGSNHDLNRALVEACEAAGYRALPIGDAEPGIAARSRTSLASPAERVLTIMDVPVLEPDWSERLERLARRNGPVIALIGFADRETVALAKARGAVACLELPYDVDDLIDVIDRTVHALSLQRWPMPGRAERPHRLPPPPRRRAVRTGAAVVSSEEKV